MEGISFVIRVRNEENTLDECLSSLTGLTMPHEILVILHLCNDRSEEIARIHSEKNHLIKIFHYNKEISRAGYENLATDVSSEHSFVYYTNWCFKKAEYLWKCKWDADFRMTPELKTYLNNFKDWNKPYKIINIGAKNSESVEQNDYFMSCKLEFVKSYFWESSYYQYCPKTFEKYVLNTIYIEHISNLSTIKTYWLENPWYMTETSEEAALVRERIERLQLDFGEEPVGLARSNNPLCNPLLKKIIDTKPAYVNLFK
jgi:glycosyltransferase involved in cell wall biosynthesis